MKTAFKEWAVVVEALLSEKQNIICRKGGIVEERGEFKVEHNRFLLFPTFFHQDNSNLIPEEATHLEQLHSGEVPDEVEIKGWFEVEKIEYIEKKEKLKEIQAQTIWSLKCLEERFDWGNKPGIHVIQGKTHKLAQPVTIPMLQSYSGCKSWIELETDIPL